MAAARPYLTGRVLDIGCGVGALAAHVPAGCYIGVDIDADALAMARESQPNHTFLETLPSEDQRFDTIVLLAVIEHVASPDGFLRSLAARLSTEGVGRIVLTTPRPAADRIHTAGAAVGLFSSHASEEHETLLGRADLEQLAPACGLTLERYQRFLFGVNQLAVYQLAR